MTVRAAGVAPVSSRQGWLGVVAALMALLIIGASPNAADYGVNC